MFSLLLILDGEAKSKKRSYEEIHPDDEGFSSHSSPAESPQVMTQKGLPACL